MKKTLFTSIFLLTSFVLAFAQTTRTPATIILDDGKTLEAYHFGQLNCSSKQYFKKYILIKGRYENVITELNNYKDIQKLELLDFNEPPQVTGENEKGTIIVYKKNGAAITLERATINLSCYGVGEKHNQLKVQMQNPITNKLFEKAIDTKDIQYVVF